MRERRRGLVNVVVLVLAGVLVAACSSGSGKPTAVSASTTSTSTTPPSEVSTPTSTRPRATVEFREVRKQIPTSDRACRQPVPATFSDRAGRFCYLLGPVLLTGAAIDSAKVIYDSGRSQWAVDVHFSNDDFVTKVAKPLVNRTIAILLDGVVQSAPTVHAGITGRDVEISGDDTAYGRGAAVRVAASILGIAPSKVR
jgi:preprotein translocase subunit SecD